MRVLTLARWAALCVVAAAPAWAGMQEDSAAQRQIRALISASYDQPGNKVLTQPIAVVEDYAIADWTQGPRGGRALLRLQAGKWQVLLCGGDGLKDAKALRAAGAPAQRATKLAARLAEVEQSLSPAQKKRFARFEMTAGR